MPQVLSAEQRAWLAAELERRYRSLVEQSREHTGGLSRTEHAHEVLEQDADDAPQRESERELDFAQAERDQHELNLVGQAFLRVNSAAYGLCIDCGEPIGFARLEAQPWVLRCVRCEAARETQSALGVK
jgi:RNA polymerase-binding protein DksA